MNELPELSELGLRKKWAFCSVVSVSIWFSGQCGLCLNRRISIRVGGWISDGWKEPWLRRALYLGWGLGVRT